MLCNHLIKIRGRCRRGLRAEVREYMARCYSSDEFVGQNSEVYVAVFGGVAGSATAG